jgi:hypothetical protein
MSSGPLSYQAGAASVCITPDEPLWLAGYAARTAPARGKISDLYARALALEDDSGQRFVIASIDLVAVTPAITEPVAETARARHGLARGQLLFTATHTHYGPEFRSDKALFFGIPPEYAARLPDVADRIIAALTSAIDRALGRLEPVRLFARKANAGFAHNRRRHGVVGGQPSNEDVVDHDVPVLECVDASARRNAIVFGYACHNTTIPPDDRRYCGDWAGFACQQLEAASPGATALFIPGAGADQDPEPRGSVELSHRYGQQLAGAVRRAFDAPGTVIVGPIRSQYDHVPLALEPVTPDALSKMLDSDDPPQRVKARFVLDQLDRGEQLITSYAAPIQVVRFGNELLLIALSGEPVVDWAHHWKHDLSGLRLAGRPPQIWLAGYCHDMFGYVPTRRVQAEGGYEAGRATLWSWIPAPFTDDLEVRITAAVRRLVERVLC